MERRIIHSAAPVVAAPASVHCAVAFELHDALKESRTFAGLASAYSTPIDTYPERTIIEPGAFAASLANPEERSRVKVLWQHTDPIGRPTRIAESPKGLEVRATVSDTTLGRDAMTLLRDKVITEMSIGFDPIVWEFEERSGERFRVITKATLWEFSLVTWGANRKAKVREVNRDDAPRKSAARGTVGSLLMDRLLDAKRLAEGTPPDTRESEAVATRKSECPPDPLAIWYAVVPEADVPAQTREGAAEGIRLATAELGKLGYTGPTWVRELPREELGDLPNPGGVPCGSRQALAGHTVVALREGVEGSVVPGQPAAVYLLARGSHARAARTAAHELKHVAQQRDGGPYGRDGERDAEAFARWLFPPAPSREKSDDPSSGPSVLDVLMREKAKRDTLARALGTS